MSDSGADASVRSSAARMDAAAANTSAPSKNLPWMPWKNSSGAMAA